MFLVIGMIGLVTSRSITRPIGQLVDTTRAIRGGDLTKRVGLSTPDELGELASSFDHMTTQLIERNQEIEEMYYQQIRETAQRDAVLTSIGDAVIMQTPEGDILLRNQAALTLIKKIESDSTARALFDRTRLTPDSLKQAHTVELASHFFSVIATQVRLSSGSLLGYVIVFRDITALLEAERLKDAMIQQMSHDLRTPLTVIHSSIDLVRALEIGNLSHQGRDFIQKAMDSLYVLERMIDQVVDVSSITSNRFSISPEYLNLSELLRQRVSNWQAQAQSCNLALTLELPSKDLWIDGDLHYLSQVLDHLIRNACSYTLPGGEVNLMATVTDGNAKIYVMDNGVGIPADELARVFDRLYRGSATEAGVTNTRGLGLGLYLSQCIVEAHGGTITIDSKVDYGTVVQIELPARQGVQK
jgi:two-component system sensor histidine kinase VicK